MPRLNVYLTYGERDALHEIKTPSFWEKVSENNAIGRLIMHHAKHAPALAQDLATLRQMEAAATDDRRPLTLRLTPAAHAALQSLARDWGTSKTYAIRLLIWHYSNEQEKYREAHPTLYFDPLAWDDNRPHPWYSPKFENEAFWLKENARQRVFLEKSMRAEGWSDAEIAATLQPLTADSETFDQDQAQTEFINPYQKPAPEGPKPQHGLIIDWGALFSALGGILLLLLFLAGVYFGVRYLLVTL